MTSSNAFGGKRFIVVTLGVTLGTCLLIALINWRINFYGVFGDVRGQSRVIVANEHQTRYLYSFNYIPTNFNALLVGSSIASNLDPSLIHGVRMYNAAIAGGNITQERLIAEHALQRGHFKLLVICINPYLVLTHGRKTGGMEARDEWAALGSADLISSYLGAAVIHFGLMKNRFTADGMQHLEAAGLPPPAKQPVGSEPSVADEPFALDPIALAELSQLIQLGHEVGASVVGVFTPVYLPQYRARLKGYADFEARIREILPPGDRLINLNDGSFEELTRRPEYFLDRVHLRSEGARETMRAIDRSLALTEPALRSPGASSAAGAE